jgi:hypothetical protein
MTQWPFAARCSTIVLGTMARHGSFQHLCGQGQYLTVLGANDASALAGAIDVF